MKIFVKVALMARSGLIKILKFSLFQNGQMKDFVFCFKRLIKPYSFRIKLECERNFGLKSVKVIYHSI